MNELKMIYGGIEAGGTKFICGIGTSDGNIIDKTSFRTTDPQTTISTCGELFYNV